MHGVAPEAIGLGRFSNDLPPDIPGDMRADLEELADGWFVGGEVRQANIVNVSRGYSGDPGGGTYNEIAWISDYITARYLEKPADWGRSVPVFWATGNGGGVGTISSMGYGSVSKNSIAVTGWADTDLPGEWCRLCGIGPTEDNRFGVTVCAPHVDVWGLDCVDIYKRSFGTSLATPVAAGICALVTERIAASGFFDDHALVDEPPTSLIKSIVVSGASDCLLLREVPGYPFARFIGPDIYTGFGVVDGKRSIEVVDGGLFDVSRVVSGESVTHVFTVPDAVNEIRCTVAWDDKPFTWPTSVHLVNNLDIEVRGPNGAVFYPFRISESDPEGPAVLCDATNKDLENNIEHIIVEDPVPGYWTLEVNGAGIVQDFDGDYEDGVRGQIYSYAIHIESFVQYRNTSTETNASYNGNPSGVAAIDAAELGSTNVDDRRDVYISALDDAGTGEGSLLISEEPVAGVPQFRNQSGQRFGENRPSAGHGPATTADLNGDGLQDLIVPAGSSGEGLMVFQQLEEGIEGGTFRLKPHWRGPLTAGQMEDIWTVACADFDGDSQIDMYVTRATPEAATGVPGPTSQSRDDFLLKNEVAGSNLFVNASADIGTPANFASGAAAWCDYDGDGDQDLAVGDCADGNGVYIYKNDPDAGSPRFELIYPPDPASPGWTHLVSDLVWTDADNDGDMDLLVTTFPAGGGDGRLTMFVNNPTIPSDPFSPTNLLDIPAQHACSGVRALDQDLDGDEDFILLPSGTGGAAVVALNGLSGPSGVVHPMPLYGIVGRTHGGLLSDWTDDGPEELFLGRPAADNQFFYNAEVEEGASLNWIGLDLRDERTLDGGTTRSVPAHDAQVTVEHEEDDYIAFAVGANGHDDTVIRVGVASGFSPNCTVRWPSGHITTHASLAVNQVNVLTAPSTVDLQAASVKGYSVLKPGEIVDWVFTWTTTYQTEIKLDRVVFNPSDPLSTCSPPAYTELYAGLPGVTVSQCLDNTGASPVYRHTVVWADRPCVICNEVYHVETGRSGVVVQSASKVINIKLCTTYDPNNPPGGQ